MERPLSPHRLRAAFATGRIDAADAIDEAIECLDAETDLAREAALRTLVAATAVRPDRTIDVVDAVDASLRPGRALTPEELAALRDLARRRPRALSPLIDVFGRALSNPDESEVDVALVARLLGDIGVQAPGVVKPALGRLVDCDDAETAKTVAEASWAVVRTTVTEPAMLRPVIAGRVWDLNSHDPSRVVDALQTLGRVGWLLPDHLVGLDLVTELVDHPASEVRVAALEVLGRTAGRTVEPGLGIPRPDRVEPRLDLIADRMTDPDPEVRQTAIATLGQFAREDTRFVSDYLEDLFLATDDEVWFVRVAALATLGAAVEVTVTDTDALPPGEIDIERVQRDVLPLLADGDDDVETAAVSLLVTLVEQYGSEQDTFVRHVVDLLVWDEYLSGGLFDGPEPLEALRDAQVSIPDISRYVRTAKALADAETEGVRSTTVELCGFVARQSPEERLAAIDVLQSMLGDEAESIRRYVLSEFEALVETDPAVAHTIGQITAVVFRYDPELRDEAASVLAACHAHKPIFLDEAIDLYCQLLRKSQERRDETTGEDEDDEGLEVSFGDDLGQPALDAFAESAPGLVTDAAPRLIERLRLDDDATEFVAESLARAAANGGSIDNGTARTLEDLIREEAVSPSLVAWLSTLLLVGTESDAVHDRAIDRLHSLAERHETTPLPSCLALFAEDQPSLAARLLVVHPPLASVPAGGVFSKERIELLSDVVAAHPRLFLRCRGRKSPYSERPLPPGHANNGDWLAELAATVPQTVPAADWLRDGFWADDGEVTARLLETVGSAGAIHGHDGLETWTKHPHPDVRAATRDPHTETGGTSLSPSSRSRDVLPDDAEFTPTNATEEVIDEIATAVAGTDPERCRRALELLVSVAVQDPELRAYARQHLLACSVTADEVAAPVSLLGALVTVAPRRPSDATTAAGDVRCDESTDTRMRSSVYQQYATFGTAPVRDVALAALSLLPAEAVDSSIMDTLTERLHDPDETVCAQAARAVAHFAREPTVVSPTLVDALAAALHGPRHVTIACCEALGQCATVDPSVVDRVVSTLETRLRARERGVRRAASSALARIGQARPDALVPVVHTIFERFRSDPVVRPNLLLASASVPVSEVPLSQRVVEPVLSELVETDDPSVSQAAGRLLLALVDGSPKSVRSDLKAVSERLEDDLEESFMPDFRDLETTPLSTYWLLRVVARYAEGNHLAVRRFEWLVVETFEALTDEDASGFDQSGQVYDSHVTARGLARVSARVAAFGGLAVYERVLERWFTDPSKPVPDPAEVAHYLVVADVETRTDAVGAVLEHAPTSHIDALLEELLETEINLNRYDAVFGPLEKLLPRTDDTGLHRRGVTVLLDSSRGHNWEICRAAVETLAGLGRTKVVRADEVIAHLIGLFDAGTRADSTVADAVGDLLQHAQLSVGTVLTLAVAHYEQSQQSPNRRQTAIRLVGILGKRHPAVRERAITTLLEAVSDDDRWVRESAVEAVVAIDDISPEAIQHQSELKNW